MSVRGKTAPLQDRIAAQMAKLEELQMQQAEQALGDHPSIVDANDAIALATKRLNENNRIIKIGPGKVQSFTERAEKWQNDFDIANADLFESRDILVQTKLEKAEIVSALLADAQKEQSAEA